MLTVIQGDCRDKLHELPDESVHCVISSPPYYGLRDYGTARWEGGHEDCDHQPDPGTLEQQYAQASTLGGGTSTQKQAGVVRHSCGCGARRIDAQLGLEPTPEAYVAEMVAIFREVRRVLRSDGVLFLNLGDSYYGSWGNYGGQNRGNGKQRTITTGSQIPNSAYDGLERHRPPTAGARRVSAYDTSDKALADSQDRDCLCESLCDACRVAYQIGKSHSDAQHAPKLEPSPYATSRGRKELQTDHLPTSDSMHQASRTSSAIPASAHSQAHASEPLLASQESMTDESSQQRREDSHPSDNFASCLLCGATLQDCAQESARKAACNCDKAGDGLDDRKTDKDVSDSAYPDYTTASLKPKDMVGIPWRVAFALQADGWYLRSEIIWAKPNPMPESVTDRPTKAHEQVFLLAKSRSYFYDAEAIREPQSPTSLPRLLRGVSESHKNVDGAPGQTPHSLSKPRPNGEGYGDLTSTARNRRSVWTIPTAPYSDAHFATFPPKLVEPCILAGTSARGCCAECGAPWERVVEHHNGDAEAQDRPKRTKGMNSRTSTLGLSGNGSQEWAERGGKTVTTGWQPTCTHLDADVVPCSVLDPFAGSGTVGKVALENGRRAVLIELNAKYCEMIERRNRVTYGLPGLA